MGRLVVILGLVLVAGGCVEDNLVACGEVSCPAGEVCASGACVQHDQLDACDGLVDGASCTPTSSAPGTCHGGVCVQFCGDGVVEAGEQCDDGNANPADGCDACVVTSWVATPLIGSNIVATTIGLTNPGGLATDRAGNLYVADSSGNRIRRIGSAGEITTIAGDGTQGSGGDGGAATSAQLGFPQGVAIDGLGNVYIADTSGNRIRRVDGNGIITTVAGGVSGSGGDGGAATSAQLSQPQSVAIDGLGNLYIADTLNNRIRRVDPSGVITTVAGTGTAAYGGDGGAAIAASIQHPDGVAVDTLRNVYIADTGNNRIRRVDATTGVITTVVGTGVAGALGDGAAATAAQLSGPQNVTFDSSGTMYLADSGNTRVRHVDAAGIITTVAGNGTSGFSGDGGPATSAAFMGIAGIAIDDNGLYITDTGNSRVRRVDASSIITTFAGNGVPGFTGDGGAGSSAEVQFPLSVAVDSQDNVYITESGSRRVRRIDAIGVITTIAGDGSLGPVGDGGPAIDAHFNLPQGVAVDGAGNIYIADEGDQRVRRIDTAGIITTIAGTGSPGFGGDGGPATSALLHGPSAVAVDAVGNIYIADTGNIRIRRIDTSGTITTVVGTGTFGNTGDNGPATSATFGLCEGIAIDGAGNLYLGDIDYLVVRRIDQNGVITTVAGKSLEFGLTGDGGPATSAELDYPEGVAFDAAGNMYIADTDNGRIRRVDTAGIITSVAGANVSAIGDGGPATGARLDEPAGVAVDVHGNIIIADSSHNLVRRVDTSGQITTIAGTVEPEGMGPLAQAQLADPRAIAIGPAFALYAGGASGTLQAARTDTMQLEVVAGRYPQPADIGLLAKFRSSSFGTVSGVAYDTAAGLIYLTESSANRIHVVTIVDPTDADTWTIAVLANATATAGFQDGDASTARFNNPTGLFLDGSTLYVADTGNHVIRAIDLASRTVTTAFGTPRTLGYFGDGGPATSALLYQPKAFTTCANGDAFIADTGNNRIRRIDATGTITTVLGDGTAASSGEGGPATAFPIDAPLGLACDALGNLYATSTTTVREIPANDGGVVDGSGPVLTIYGAAPRDRFPSSVTSCLTGIAVVDPITLQVTDSCTGLVVQLVRM